MGCAASVPGEHCLRPHGALICCSAGLGAPVHRQHHARTSWQSLHPACSCSAFTWRSGSSGVHMKSRTRGRLPCAGGLQPSALQPHGFASASQVMLSYRVGETGAPHLWEDGSVLRVQAELEAAGFSLFVGEAGGLSRWPIAGLQDAAAPKGAQPCK